MKDKTRFINLPQGFSINSALPIDNRLVLNQHDLDELAADYSSDPTSIYNLGK